ncbi:proteasome subunit beta, putative [Ichthyophthirius multifiliis]|uniref:Proteasome subunit beta n=1 Tax=Ichthyophthirius multifiliis TaxID=5932 RepID=G0QNJ6_ICHMU|nr:proteasome subunit beta, putative [Ichthyophthirius multifiliis]EGR33212.1 proteasome subunit beta, putative [Ichthyophthirius multifiliis]|eukprot:XP_004037198.1 proteasome subunit beta, putative [Ichthyophthirius multifiliis]
MDSAFGLAGKDFVILVTDSAVAYSIVKLKNTEDKIVNLDENKLMAMSGESAYRLQFSDYIARNIALFKYRNGTPLNTQECASFIRSELAYGIRNGPYMVNCLIAGFDYDQPQLYWVDYMGTLQKSVKAAHGYAAHFVLSTLDNFYKPELTLQEGIEIMKKCVHELKTRFLISQQNFVCKIVTKEGFQVYDLEK